MTWRTNIMAASITVAGSLLLVILLLKAPALLAGIGALALLGACFMAPLSMLPAVAVLLWALVPTPYLPISPTIGRYMSPAIVVLAIWCVRIAAGSKTRPIGSEIALPWLVGALALWLGYASLGSIDPVRSLIWSTNALIVLGVITVARRATEETREYLLSAWALVSIGLGTFALAEWLTKYNPLAPYLVSDGKVIEQVWSVYRVETTIGFPLVNGLFFATSAAMFFGLCIRHRTARNYWAGAFATVGLMLTVSRSATLGLVLGLTVTVLLLLLTAKGSGGRKMVAALVVLILAVGISQSPLLTQRDVSAEGQSSTAYRDVVVEVSSRIVEDDGYLGSGPGTSQDRIDKVTDRLIVENSILQLVISTGIPGTSLFLCILVIACTIAVRQQRWEAVAGMLAYTTTSAGFNAWDSNPATLGLLGLLLILANPGGAARVSPKKGGRTGSRGGQKAL